MKKKGFTLTPKFGVTRRGRGGFTLIELLVVIAIIGLLSTLAVVALNSARQKARDAKRVADIKQVQTALELFYNDANGYPGQDAGGSLTLGSTDASCLYSNGTGDRGFGAQATCSSATTVYMGLVPTNPEPGGVDYAYSAVASGNPCTSDCSTYTIELELEGSVGNLDAGTNCATPDGVTSGPCPAG